ncbi:MAG: hypothetical protein ACFFDT_08175 [Candidatus Hodarchaeota archaeon]
MTIYAIIISDCSGIPHVHVSQQHVHVDSILWSGFFSAILAFITNLQDAFPDRHYLEDLYEDYFISTRDLSVAARRNINSNTCVLCVGTPEDENELRKMAETALSVFLNLQNNENVKEQWKIEMIRLLESREIPIDYADLSSSLLNKLDGCQAVGIYTSEGLRLNIEVQEGNEILREGFEKEVSPVLGSLGIGKDYEADRIGLPTVHRLPEMNSTILSSRISGLIILAWCQSSYEGMNRLRFTRECRKYFGE